GSNFHVYGDWIENIDRVTAPAGVSVSIRGKFNGFQNNTEPFKGKGKVSLKINTSNATPGNKTIRLINDPPGGDTFEFTITVVGSPTVTSVDVPTPSDPFQEITVTLNGTRLQEARDPASGAIVIDNLIPFITVGGNASVSSVRVLGASTATSLQAKIFFSALIQDATVELTLRSNNNCVPLGVTSIPNSFKTRVRVRSSNVKNYVESITFPTGNTFNLNSTGTINLNLLFAAPTSSGIKLRSGLIIPRLTPTGDAGNSKVFFKFVPENAFGDPEGNPFPTEGGFIVGKANPGEDIIPIRFKVINCLGGQSGQTNAVSIETWMHTTNTNLPPNKVVQTFSVRCIQ
ncbi:MAG: hypothetical protein AABZ61_11135, partial [Bacteroidota bacterium]